DLALGQVPPELEHPGDCEEAAEDSELDEGADNEVVRVLGVFDSQGQAEGEVGVAEVGPTDAEPRVVNEQACCADPVLPADGEAGLEEGVVVEAVADDGDGGEC